MPCEYAMVALRAKYGDDVGYGNSGNSIYEYSSLIYKFETYLLMYLEDINVVPPEAKWTVPQEVQDIFLRTSRTDSNLGHKFYNYAIAKDNGACSFFKWLNELSPPSSPSTLSPGLETSNFRGLAKFNLLQRLQE
ncbi:hypothetical protein CQW23_02342 [Capsicum baccatum]|uniref:Uncharacterized protein n=1 Tax=Capsicum baccatum TaxID=33114 RepID=A0A2G2XRA0_CAPBA|nr:hypothetical protein CQW23_02342 [Capsicum baccatum]